MTIRSRSRKQAQIAHNTLLELGHVISHQDGIRPDTRNWDDKPQKTHAEIMANIKRRSAN